MLSSSTYLNNSIALLVLAELHGDNSLNNGFHMSICKIICKYSAMIYIRSPENSSRIFASFVGITKYIIHLAYFERK